METYFTDQYGHKLPHTARYIVKLYCRECQKIWDKRDCYKHIIDKNGELIVKQRGQLVHIVNT